ncbi:hypothetical protein NKJ36_29825 [Mesorhizobium sp. M0142]|uniref:hypothetical protein n=1 Tax=Mesorhizobium sp. M0142 TaxID=2956894 RepID=UPI00333A8861
MVRRHPLISKLHSRVTGFRTFPQIRWSLSHMRELTATVNVWCGPGAPSILEHFDRTSEIDALAFTDANGRCRGFKEALFDTYTDGILVLHRGRIVYERYLCALERNRPHACLAGDVITSHKCWI